MSHLGRVSHPVVTPPLPASIWVVALAALVSQVLMLTEQGLRGGDAVSLGVSVGIGAFLAGYISAGVVRARLIRLVIAWLLLVLSFLAHLAEVASGAASRQGPLAVVSLTLATVLLAGLAAFHRTDWYAWQRRKPPAREGARIGQLVAIGVLVGVVAGVVAPSEDGLNAKISVSG